VDWIHLAQDKGKWRELMKTVIHLSLSKDALNILTTWKKYVLLKKDDTLWIQSEVRREWTLWLWYWILRPIKFVFCLWDLKFLRRWNPVFWSYCARFNVECSPVNSYLTFERICSVRLQRRLKIKFDPEEGENKCLRNIYNLMRWQRHEWSYNYKRIHRLCCNFIHMSLMAIRDICNLSYLGCLKSGTRSDDGTVHWTPWCGWSSKMNSPQRYGTTARHGFYRYLTTP